MSFKIVLLGSIPKGDNKRKNWSDWKIKYKKYLTQISNVEFSDGDAWKDETKPELVVGHDLSLIKEANIVIVNAESKIGAGTAQEMLMAKYFCKPVITILPKNTHHRKSNIIFDNKFINDWIHPFILTSSDFIAESPKDATSWIKKYQKNPKAKKIKDIKFIEETIYKYYKAIKK